MTTPSAPGPGTAHPRCSSRDTRTSPVPIAGRACAHLAGCSGPRMPAAAHIALCVCRCVKTDSAARCLLGQRALSQVQPTAHLQVHSPLVARRGCVSSVSGPECRHVSIAMILKMLCRCGSRQSRTVFDAQGTRYVRCALALTVCSGAVTCWRG